jgi:hypothetical protein
MEKMLDTDRKICYNKVMNQPVGDYMIELTMSRMERVEAVLATAKSEWAIRHWSETLQYFKRQLQQLGANCE